MDTEKTKIIFRKYKEGDIVALFPELPGSNDYGTCTLYQHIGQHGHADINGVIDCTTLVTEQEYAPLFAELTAIGYNLQVCKRYTYKMQSVRIAECKRSVTE